MVLLLLRVFLPVPATGTRATPSAHPFGLRALEVRRIYFHNGVKINSHAVRRRLQSV